MIALAHWIALSAGWPRRLIALLAGACGALAMAPVDAFPAMIVPMTAAVWLLDGADRASGDGRGWRAHLWPSLRSAAGTGWWWGLGYFVGGLWWLGSACLVEPDKFAWALPISVLGVPAILALFAALGFAVSRLLWLPGPGRVLSLTLGLGLAEGLRSILFTGFPWNEYGMALGNILVLAQAASLVGLHGLTLATIALCAAPATLADTDQATRRGGAWRRLLPTGLALAGFCAIAAFGTLRLADGHAGTVAGVRLRIMQPDIPQDAAFTYANGREILRRYLALSDKATSSTTTGIADVTHLIWPESPFPFILSRQPEAIDAITAALPAGTVLITGAARSEGQPGSSPPPRYYNAIQVLTSDGSIVDSYDKVHLVPFGEYVPFEWLLGRLGIEHFVDVPGGFTAGTHHRLLNAPGLPPIVPAICYEAIFPDEVTADIKRPSQGLILNLTNDGWFGNTSGPYQHFAQARLRAIEQGLPLVRAANTGISAIVDPYGRIVASLPIGVANVLDGPLPDALRRTPYGRFHELGPMVIAGVLLTIVFFLLYRRRRFVSGLSRR